MKAINTRIGNYYCIFDSDQNDYIVNALTLDDFAYINAAGGDFSDFGFEPIILTHEWLKKSGCKVKGDTAIIDRFKLIYRRDYKYWYIIDNIIQTYFSKVEFVHEWQNFFMFMNGEELTFKL